MLRGTFVESSPPFIPRSTRCFGRTRYPPGMLARGRRAVAILTCILVQAIVLASDHFGKQKCLAGFPRHLLHSFVAQQFRPHCLAGTESKVQSSKFKSTFLCGVRDAKAHAFSVVTTIQQSCSRWLVCMSSCATTAAWNLEASIRSAN